jgi:uncharacterized protein (TIGR02611 family)
MWSKPGAVVRFLLRNSKRVGITIAGGLLVLIGIVLLVLPGPGMLVVVLGFAVLGTEYAWAAAALERTKKTADSAARVAKRGASNAGRAASDSVRAVTRKVNRKKV